MELKLDLFKQSSSLRSFGNSRLMAFLVSLFFLFSMTATVQAAPPIFSKNGSAFSKGNPVFSKNGPSVNPPKTKKSTVEPLEPGPHISCSQVVWACFNSNNGDAGNLTVQFRVYVQNTGTTALAGIQVFNDLAFTMAPFFVDVIPGSISAVSGTLPTINGAWDGDGNPQMFSGGGALAPGAMFIYQYEAEFDPNAALGITPFSQVRAESGGVSDESDVGDDPASDNPLFFGDAFGNLLDIDGDANFDDDGDLDEFPVGTLANFDDPTPVPMPRVSLTKEVIGFADAASGVVGNRDVEFHLIIENTGNLPMDRIDLEDDLFTQMGLGFVQVLSVDINEPTSTAVFNPTINNGYDGGITSFDIFDQTSGYLRPGEIIDITLIVEVDPDGATPACLAANQAFVKTRPGYETTPFLLTSLVMPDGSIKISDDLSDDGNVPEDNNNTFPGATVDNEDDPTIIEIDQIRVTKEVTNCTPVVDPTGCTKNFEVTFHYFIQNTGSLPLDNVELFDDLNAAGNLGPGFVSLVGVNVVGGPSAANGAYDGTSGAVSAISQTGPLGCGELIEVEIMLIANSDLVFTPTTNQARAEGDYTLSNGGGGGTTEDLSDSGNVPQSYNDTAPGATPDSHDDPTPVYLPRINVSKEILSFTPAASGVIGNFDVEFHVTVVNSGNVDLDRLQVSDLNIPGFNMVDLLQAPGETGAQTAVIAPVFSPNFFFDGLVYDGTSGQLGVDEVLDFTFVVEMDADAICLPTNQVVAQGRGIDADGNPILDPVTGLEKIMTDLSDGGPDPLGDNAGAQGDDLTCDNPTPIEIPEIHVTKRVIQCDQVADPTGCTKNYDITFEYIIENTGSFDLTDVSLFDDLSAGGNLGGSFVSFTGATTDVGAIDGAYAGLGGSILAPGATLTCGQQATVTVTAVFDSNLAPVPSTNQATAEGTFTHTDNPATTGTVDDLSDSGTDPESYNDTAPGATPDNEDDPTPVPMPRINVSKEVLGFVQAASGVIGNFDVTFHVSVYNSGNVDLDRIQVRDLDITGANMIDIVQMPAPTPINAPSIEPVFNPGFFLDGDVFDGTSGLFKPDETIDFTFVVEMDADAICIPTNQMVANGRAVDENGNAILDPVTGVEKNVSDLSDSGPDPLGDNFNSPSSTAGCDDPTPIEIPEIHLTKHVIQCDQVFDPTGCTKNYEVTFKYTIENTGSIDLTNIQLLEEFSAAANFGIAYQNLVAVNITLDGAATGTAVNGAFDGTNGAVSAITTAGPLACGEQICIEITVIIDSDLSPAPATNQATATGDWTFTDIPATTGTVDDLSDTGTVPEDPNDTATGASTGGQDFEREDDPTPVYLPRINAAKEVIAIVPAASGVIGNFDVTFHVNVINSGNVHLDNLQISDLNLFGLLNINFVGVVQMPTKTSVQNATIDPVFGQDFFVNTFIYDGTSGLLEADQVLDFTFTLEMNADQICIPTNQVRVWGRGLDVDGQPVVDPITGMIKIVTDVSDSGPDPLGDNFNEPSSQPGCDDPTPIEIPDIKLTKEVMSTTQLPGADGCSNNYEVTFKYIIENTGSIPLNDILLKDKFNNFPNVTPNLGVGFVSVTNVSVVSGPAIVNPAFDGTDDVTSAIIQTAPLDCHFQICVTITVIVDAERTPVPPTNQANVMASWEFTDTPPTTGMITDLSDSGNIPEDPNDTAAGATTGGLPIEHHDDPTPVYLPRIRASKEVVGFVPAASGTIGNFDVTFHVRVQNAGNVPLDNLQVEELDIPGINMISVVQMPTTTGAQTATVAPVYGQDFFVNSLIYDGTSGELNTDPDEFLDFTYTIEMDADAVCLPTNQVLVSGRFVNPATGAVHIVTDLSDSGDDPNTANLTAPTSTAGCDDPTPVELPDIKISKEVESVTPMPGADGCSNNFEVVYRYVIENTGSIDLTDVTLKDRLSAPTNLGAGFVSLTGVTVVSGPAVPNPTYNPTAIFPFPVLTAINSTGPLACNSQIVVTITAVYDADLTPAPASNQANAMANWAFTDVPPTTGMVSDFSDSGNNPENRNDAAAGATLGGLDIDHHDDPTPTYLPRIRASKEVTGFVPAASGEIGNFDVTFRVRVENRGNVPLDRLQVDELNIPGANMIAVVQEPTTNGPQNATTFPVYGQDFFLNGNIYDGTSGLLEPDQILDFSYTIEMDADAICIPTNQVLVSGRWLNEATNVETIATDLSDSGSAPNLNNAAAPSSAPGCDDPTPVELPDIKVSKTMISAIPVADPTGCTNNFTVLFRYAIENTGSIPLNTVTLKDQFSSATNLSTGFVSVSNVTVVSGPATVNALFNGTSATQSAITSTGPLLCNEQIVVTITAIVNGDFTPVPPTNQAVAMANWAFTNTPPTTGMVTDLSDSDNNPNTPEDRNDDAPGATLGGLDIDHHDDPTPVYLHRIRASKEVTGFVPAASGVIGNYDVTFRVRVQNQGNVPLDNLQVDELNIPGANMVAVVQMPTTNAGQNAATFPVYGQDFFLNGNIYDGTSGILNPDQILDFSYTIEMDADAICIPTNQVLVTGRFINPASSLQFIASDLSDSGNNPNSNNAAAPSSAAGCNDPTPVEIPDIKLSKEVQSVTMVADPTNCTNNFTVVFKYTIENVGSIPLTAVTLKDQLNALGNLGAGFVSLQNVTVVSGPAAVNPAYNGTSAVISAINSTGPLACNSQIMVTITAIVNGDLTPVPPVNQAVAMANWTFTNTPPTTGMVTDLSDSGNNPENRNDAAAGATLGGLDIDHHDDPTPVYLPRIRASKEVTAFVPAASGVIGNFDVTFHVRVENRGNVPLDRLQVDELNIPGANMVAVVQEPTTNAAQNATTFPVYGQDFFLNGNIYDGTSGLLEPDQILDFSFTIEMDADAICIPTNQVSVSGRWVNPATHVETIATDLSDSGSDPNANNAAAPSSAPGCDDPTPIEIPDIKITKEVQSVTPVADPTGCTNNFTVVFKYTIENTGSIPLNNVLLKDNFGMFNNLGLGYVSVTNVSVVSGPAIPVPLFPAASLSAIGSTGPLACNQQIVATITVIVNGDLTPFPATNQASTMANWTFTNTPATTGMVSDDSDSGPNPEDRNDAAPGATLGGLAIDHHDDPTPVYLPRIRASKEVTGFVPAASGEIGNYDVTFRVRVENRGNVPLDELQVDELNIPGANMVAVVQMPTTNGPQNATIFPVYGQDFFLNGNIYDGTSGQLDPDQILDYSFTMEMDADAICIPTNQVAVSGRFVNPATGAITVATDLSDSGNNPNANNAAAPSSAAGCNDPTPIEIPDIKISKEVQSVTMVSDPTGCTNNFTVVFKYVIENVGSIPLTAVQLKDQFNAAGNMGAGFVSVSNVTVLSGPATAVGGFTGTSAVQSAITSSGPLACNQQIMVTITTIINGDLTPVPPVNQAVAMANWTYTNTPATTGMVSDNSDSGNNPENRNDAAPGATLGGLPIEHHDDPTPVYLPRIRASKEVTGFVPAASGVIGNYDVTFRVRVQNNGNVPLDELQVDELNIPGANMIAVVQEPTTNGPQSATIFPVYGQDFFLNGNIYDGTSGLLEPDQLLDYSFTMEMDADAICIPTNQVLVSGRFVNPATGAITVATDLSDSGSDPNLNNAGAPSSAAGCNDPTPIEIPDIKISKEVQSVTMVSDPTGCTNNFSVVFKYTIENVGSIPLTQVQLKDQFNAAANLGAGFVSVSNVTVVSGPATATGGFTGTSAVQSAIISNAPLACNSQIMVTITVIVNGDLTPVPPVNQAVAMANWTFTNAPATTGMVTDLSDSGNNPENRNDAAAGATLGGLDIDHHNDPTPVYLPRIRASKEVTGFVPAASGEIGNYDVTFHVRVENRGNVPLDQLQVDELNIPGANMVAVVQIPTTNGAQNAAVFPVYGQDFFLNGNIYDGTSGVLNPDQILDYSFTMEMDADAICIPTNQVLVSGRFVNPATGVVTVATDLSDSGSDPNSPNSAAPSSAAGCNDPTPIEIPDIKISKEVQSVTMVADPTGCTNNFSVVFKYVIENVGSIPLTAVQLKDQFNAAGNMGAGFVSVSNVTVVSGPATAVGGFTGTSAAQSAINSTGPLACNSQIMVTITTIINGDLTPVPPTNQAVAMANWTYTNNPPTTGMVTDNSDSGNNPENRNDTAPGATLGGLPIDHHDDPTPVYLPRIRASKEVVGFAPAASGVIGNWDVTFRVRVQNNGNVPLDNLQVDELNIPGANMVAVVQEPTTMGGQNASVFPVYGQDFFLNGNIYDGTSGLLMPDELLDYSFTMEMDADAICIPTNQVLVSGRFVNDATGAVTIATDLSDSGSNPNNPNSAAPSSAAGCNDPTPIELPDIQVTKEVQSVTMVADPTGCTNNFTVVFRYVIENNGSIPLTTVTLKDQLNAAGNLGAGFVSVSNVTVVSGPATAVGGFTGTSAGQSAITSSGPLACNSQIVVTITAIINGDLTPVPPVNQAVAMANWAYTNTPPTTGMVTDLSDSGNSPESPNDAAAGASAGGVDEDRDDDPTPVYLPRIRAAKEVVGFAPAASGVIGNFDVTFRIRVENRGNVPLDNLQIDELNIPAINMVSVVQIPTTNGAQNATVFPVYGQDFFVNGFIYDGTSGLLKPDELLDFSFTMEMDADAICLPMNQVLVSGRFVNDATGAVTIATDLSDSGSNPNSPNAAAPSSAAGCNDPTPIELPEVRLTKQVTNCVQVADPSGCSKNYTVTFKFTIENTGSIPLSGLQLLDQLNAASNLAGGFVSFTSATVLMGPAVINATYNGTQANVSIINSTGPLACGQQIMVQVVAVFNSDLTPAPAFNQASTTANYTFTNTPPTTGQVSDLSDSGPDPESYNNDSPGATPDNEDDPTPVYLPRINASKEVTGFVPAESGTIGNYDVTFRVRVVNTGNTDLDRIQLDELNIPGINMISVVQIPTTMPTQNATVFPVYGQDFFINGNIYDGTSGLLKPDQLLDFWFTIEMDADAICQPGNQILASGRGVDPDGNPIVNPATGMVKIVTDLTDGGPDTRTANTGHQGNTGGCDDPTRIEIPEIHVTKQVTAATMVNDPTGCTNNYNVSLKFTIENTGSIPLTNVQLFDQLNAAGNFGAGFVNLVSATINSGPATINGAYNGTSGVVSIISSTGPLACNQQIMVTLVAQINADLTPAPNFNQATTTATYTLTNVPATTGQVSDQSDSGSNPEGPNDDAPGASSGGQDIDREDDKTPVYLPKIKISKEVVACGPASTSTLGNMDVTLHFQILNTGNVPLTNLCLTDNMAAQLGAGVVVKSYSYDLTQLTTATDWPSLKNDYQGGANGVTNIFDCTSGLLMPDEVVDVTVELEINPNAAGAILPALNQATATGEAVDFDLNPVNLTVSDLSDGGSDPNDSNAGYPGDTGGCNDKTPISLPHLLVAKEVISCVPKGPFDPGDFLVTFRTRIQNTGNVRLLGITATDNLAAQIGAAFIAVTTPPTVTTTNAGAPAPAANVAFNAFANNNLLLANSSILNPGGVITITWTAEINPNALLPEDSLTNQVLSTATGLHPNVAGGLIPNQVVLDPQTGTPKPVSDLSDSGSVPESYNGGEPGDTFSPGAPWLGSNDPTPIEIPSINVSKKVICIVPTPLNDKPGEFDVTFLVKVTNTGNVNLADFTLDDDISAGLGAAYLGLLEAPHYVAPYLLWDWPGVFNPLFDGDSDIHIFDNQFNLLKPGETYSLEYKIRVNPNALLPIQYLWNQAVATGRGIRDDGSQVWTPQDGPVNGPAKWTSDLSDDGIIPESLNPGQRGDNIPVAGTHDNPTPLEIPSVNLSKAVVTVIKVPGEVPPGNARLTFEIKMENTGNVQLRNLMMEDAVRTQMGTAWLQFAPGGLPTIFASTATQNPTLNGAFNGLAGAGAMIFNGTTGRLDPGQTITVRITVDLDPNKTGLPNPLKNQANGKAVGFNWINPANAGTTFVAVPDPCAGNAGPMQTTDLSDSGKLPESNNLGEPCDMGTHNDPTPFEIPFILSAKQEVPDLWGSTCAKSGTNGNVDITFLLKLVNVGNTDLDHITLMDNLQQQFGSAFVKVLNGGISIDSSTATMNPTIQWSYNGNSQPLIFNGSDGLLKPNERIVVRITAEINPNAPGAPKPYDNQAMAFARAKRADGTLIFVPMTTSEWIVDDKTDGGENPESVNLGWPGDTGGSNDPLDFRLPMTTKFPTDLVINPTCASSVEDQLLPWIAINGGAVVAPAPGCGPISWSSNFPNGGLDWLVADIYGCGCSGTWTIQFKATDECGHDVCFNVKVIIEDKAPPCWDMLPMSKTFYCGSGGDNDVQKWLDEVGGAWFFDPCALNIDSYNNYNPATATPCDADGQVVTFSIRDECGNVNTATATLKIVDSDAPEFTSVPANVTINCNATLPAAGNPVAVDDCTAAPIITLVTTNAPGLCPGEIIYTRTWTATDFCGNTATAKQTVTKKDISKPFFTSVPADLTITCPAVPVFGNVVANDLCAGAAGVTVTFVDKIIFGTSCPAGYTIRRTWTATDLCGNTRSVARTIEVEPDPNPPFISTISMSSPQPITIPCSSLPVFDNVTATSDCPTGTVNVVVTNTSVAATCTTNGTFTRTWTATDGCGSTKTVSQTITQLPDTQPPVISGVPADLTVDCGLAPALATATASDNCTTTPTLTFVDGNNGANCLASQTAIKWRIWTATDGCGLVTTAKQTITEKPAVTTMALVSVPPPQFITCTQPIQFGVPVVSTTCTVGTVTETVTDTIIGDNGCEDVLYIRNWAYADGCGNHLYTSQTITVVADTDEPTFTFVPASPMFIDCNTLQPTEFATANDDCSGAATIIYSVEVLGNNPCDPMSGNPVVITWTAVDACGNVSMDSTLGFTTGNGSGIFFISAPQAPKVYACGETMEWDTPVCKTPCGDGSYTLTYSETTGGDCATGKFVTRTWSAKDQCGSEVLCSHTQYFAPDTELPVITFTSNVEIIECGEPIPTFTPSVSDNCGVQSLEPVSDIFQGDTLLRTWLATDDCGNTSTAIQYFIYQDTEAPVFVSIPANQTVQCGQPINFGSPAVIDDCGNATTISFSDATIAGSCAGNYTVVRTWTVSDDSGNSSTAQATISVKDDTDPTFANVPLDNLLSCDAVLDIPTPTVNDCSGVTLTFADNFVQGQCTGDYVITRTWTATDGCGNVAIADAKFTLVDDIAPTFDPLSTTTMAMTFAEFEVLNIAVGATDNCGIVNITDAQTTLVVDNCEATYLMNWTATDDCGNFAQQVVEITITDELPTITANTLPTLQTGETFTFNTSINGGLSPFGYAWTITGNGWFIVGGENTLNPMIVAGTGTASLTLTVTNGIGCLTTQTWILEAETVGIDGLEPDSFELFPVPTVENVEVKFTLRAALELEFRITDDAGRLIETRRADCGAGANSQLFDLRQLAAGTYMLEIRTADGASIVKPFVRL